jgi:dihydroneopterin aldolase/2-amino-4-hydroxy-6-hydroxymethyldihydropteridine diphosphokinase
MTTLRITGILASGRHGASSGERDQAQDFVVDLEVEVGPEDDELSQTADYREIAHAARRTIDERSFALLETIVREVAHAVAALPGVKAVRAVVHKPQAARRLGVDDVSAVFSVGTG